MSWKISDSFYDYHFFESLSVFSHDAVMTFHSIESATDFLTSLFNSPLNSSKLETMAHAVSRRDSPTSDQVFHSVAMALRCGQLVVEQRRRPMLNYGNQASPPKLPPVEVPPINQHFVEVILEDESGNLLAHQSFVLVGPDGKERPGSTDAQGRGYFDSIPPGPYKVKLKDMDARDWSIS